MKIRIENMENRSLNTRNIIEQFLGMNANSRDIKIHNSTFLSWNNILSGHSLIQP